MHSISKLTVFCKLQTNSVRHYSDGVSRVPIPYNEPVREYLKGSKERKDLLHTVRTMKKTPIEVPLIIGGKEIRTGNLGTINCPYDHKHVLGTYHRAGPKEVQLAVDAALDARKKWASMPFEDRAAIFLRLADLITGPHRNEVNATTILGQSKNLFQSEIDAICELADFIRFNVKFAEEIYTQNQPMSSKGVWNHLKYRPLEGFVLAISPFNFTAIGGNLTLAPALMGNVVVWKPSDFAIYSNYYLMKLYKEAGIPDGVINFIPGDPNTITDTTLFHPDFSGLHFTGSTSVFRDLWKRVGNNIDKYRSFPRLVGESGGKDFVFAHPSAHVPSLVTALLRGAFEFSGQKCSAASRAYIPASLWPQVEKLIKEDMSRMKIGSPENPENMVNAVIHRGSFEKIKSYINFAKNAKDAKILVGGNCDDSVGYFIEPTIVVTTNKDFKLIQEEIFGPVLTLYVYNDAEMEETLKAIDSSIYALTGSIFAQDRYAIRELTTSLENAAGNFYVNDKPTGAVVGQQPFGGARASGTNDKAGSYLNLLRWVSPRTIKETLIPPTDFRYPYMDPDEYSV